VLRHPRWLRGQTPAASRSDDVNQARPASSAPKSITLAMNREPTGFGPHQATDTNLTPLFLGTRFAR
jgi:hypothetical protein